MTQTSEIRAAMAAVRALVEGVETLPRGELLQLQREVFAVRREWDVVSARVAAEVSRRSVSAEGSVGLARREGHRSAEGLVAAASGGSQAEAGRLARVGKVMADAQRALDVEPSAPTSTAPTPVFPHLASALSAGRLSVDAGALIAAALERVAEVLEGEALRDEISTCRPWTMGRCCGLPR